MCMKARTIPFYDSMMMSVYITRSRLLFLENYQERFYESRTLICATRCSCDASPKDVRLSKIQNFDFEVHLGESYVSVYQKGMEKNIDIYIKIDFDDHYLNELTPS